MDYLIDGYNLLHHVGLLLNRAVAPGQLEKARLALLTLLAGRLARNPTDSITVVFDASQAPRGVDNTLEHEGVRVHFAHSEQADDLIETLIRQAATPQHLTVVSNDRRLRDAARRRRCVVMECVDYWEGTQAPAPLLPRGDGQDGKPEGLSAAEVEEWRRQFGDLDDDPGFRELYDPPWSKD